MHFLIRAILVMLRRLFGRGQRMIHPSDYAHRPMTQRARLMRTAMNLAIMREKVRHQYFADKDRATAPNRTNSMDTRAVRQGKKLGEFAGMYMRRLLEFGSMNLRRQIRRIKTRTKNLGEAGETDGNNRING